MILPTFLIVLSTLIFLIWERARPGRLLPASSGWYVRALLINFVQLGITLGTGNLWFTLFPNGTLLNLSQLGNPFVGGFIGWFIGTFIFYWWHRLRHQKGFWVLFHQIHHSASRIEVLTSFYKHPIEIFANSFLTAIILFPVLGLPLIASFWYNFFAATGEYFYHANVKTPKWLRYFIQTPELHSIHHQFNLHKYNFSDIPIWDRLFGTYSDSTEFTDRCGFPDGAEQRLLEMLAFRDVYDDGK